MDIAERQRRFYEGLYRRHGDSPQALSYRDRETQFERFERLGLLFRGTGPSFTVHEVGCGLGDFGLFLESSHPGARYSGSDICRPFVEQCSRRFPDGRFYLRDMSRVEPDEEYDYVTASGLFNPRLETSPEEWRGFIRKVLGTMYRMARRGIAANFLTSHHDPQRSRSDLHYESPGEMIDFVVRELSRHYEIDAAGPLYEFTLRVHRPDTVRERFPDTPFARYFRADPDGAEGTK